MLVQNVSPNPLVDEQPHITLLMIESMIKRLQSLVMTMNENGTDQQSTRLYRQLLIMIEEAVQYEIKRCANTTP